MANMIKNNIENMFAFVKAIIIKVGKTRNEFKLQNGFINLLYRYEYI